MKIILFNLITLISIFGIRTQCLNTSCSVFQAKAEYTLIRDNLYSDSLGNLYFKTINRSNPKRATFRYISVIYSSEFKNIGYRAMKEVIDIGTFKALSNDYYEDTNFIYYFFRMSDGGTMNIVEGAESESFSVFKDSYYGKDSSSIFYRGEIIDSADVSTFEPILTVENGIQIGLYAKDRFNYYCGGEILKNEEIKDLIKRTTKDIK